MDMCLLEYFIVVAEAENLGSAATRLNMPTASLAEHLSVLEDELGLMLFRQTFPGIELTAAGSTFLPHARLIMAEVEAAKRNIRKIVQLSERTRRWAGLYKIFQDSPTA